MDDTYTRKINYQLNVLSEPLSNCSCNKNLKKKIKLTGIYRDGFCRTEKFDFGLHTVCSIMTDEFLEFSKLEGNNLSDPVPEFNFEGLTAGDRWCLCAKRWKQAYFMKKAPKVILESTNILTLSEIELSILKKFFY